MHKIKQGTDLPNLILALSQPKTKGGCYYIIAKLPAKRKVVKIMLRIFLTNLGKYNEGQLIGEWVGLPCTNDELEAVKERIGISDKPDENGNYYEEWFITDYESDIQGVKVGEYDDLDELNELAEELDNLDIDQQQAIKAFLEDGSTFEEALEGVQDGNYRIYSGCDDMTDVAMEVVEECEYLNGVPENVARYFDYEAFGRDLDLEGKYYYIDGDMVEIW